MRVRNPSERAGGPLPSAPKAQSEPAVPEAPGLPILAASSNACCFDCRSLNRATFRGLLALLLGQLPALGISLVVDRALFACQLLQAALRITRRYSARRPPNRDRPKSTM